MVQDAFNISSFVSPEGFVSASTLPDVMRLHALRDDIGWIEDGLILETLDSAMKLFDGTLLHIMRTQRLITEPFSVWISGHACVLLSFSLLKERVSKFISAAAIASKVDFRRYSDHCRVSYPHREMPQPK